LYVNGPISPALPQEAIIRIPLDLPAGLNSDDTSSAASPAWADGSNVRFRLARPQVIGGWEKVSLSTVSGKCRAVFNWTDNSNRQTLAFGTHTKLHLWQGGALYDITPSANFTAGQADGTGQAGYGTGAYGVGGYGEPSTDDYFPLTWSLGAYGQTLIACPRGQTIFQWSNNTAVVAAKITNSPAAVTYALVSPQRQIFALGCNEEVSGTFNPLCIRHSGVGDATTWTTTASSASTAREYVLPGGGRIVAGRVIGRSILVWTSHGLWLGTYVGQIGQVWRFDKVGDKCGLAGPNAAVVLGTTAYWVSPDRQFYSYPLGGAVSPIACPIREDFADNLAASQADKIVASSIAEFSEVRFDYPDARDGYENSRYLAVCVDGVDAGSWYRGQMARTAMVDAGPAPNPCGVTSAGVIYWHEKGQLADGGKITAYIETADIQLDANNSVLCRSVWPDLAEQVGPVSITIKTRQYPQGDTTTYGPYTVAVSQDAVNFKTSGRFYRIRFSSDAAPSFWRLGRPIFDAKLRGRR
jgi:hypothetical protein